MSAKIAEVNPTKPLLQELRALAPEHCPYCAGAYLPKDVKELTPEHGEQVRWSCFCGWCGAIYTIEVEP